MAEINQIIKNARDTLVGKVPDPKAQIEQITIALMYKFMDAKDLESIDYGGEPSFFTNDYKDYAFHEIIKTPNNGKKLELYRDGLEKMGENLELPEMFRSIFKNAFLPYNDAATLALFLKEIDKIPTENTELLGTAFEDLLSNMGSQGDAGQFRTPRHIIDFIVQVVKPQKDERILDPACGTAGFLVSAFHYIYQNNKEKMAGDLLSVDEKAYLMNSMKGLDISPDMVRLSKVNLYLHGFKEPKITEYDTLTDKTFWKEKFDVILANPPFMTPKGGIKPHELFRVKANRSEVLFVDYIYEHLTENGRAGVIVPEGIVFQSANAYKELRKNLLDDYLFAVVSLPSGVFNPYSGVKTSILLLDQKLSKQTDKILFVKISADGFDLGAQRRNISQNDIPTAIEIIEKYKAVILSGSEESQLNEIIEHPLVTIATKEQIAKQDYILVGERYKEAVIHNTEYPMVELGDHRYFEIESGGTPSSTVDEYWNGDINWATLVDIPQSNFITDIYSTQRKITQMGLKNSSAKLLPIGTVIVSSRATIGRIAITKVEMATNQGFKNIIIKDTNNISSRYVALAITILVPQMEQMASGGTFKEISKKNISTLKIPLPPLSVQEQIVAEIEGYQKIIDGAKQVVENYKPTIKIDPNWEMVELGQICDVRDGTHDSPKYEQNGYPLITSKNIKDGVIDFSNVNYLNESDYISINKRSKVDKGDIIMPMIGTIGNPIVVNIEPNFAIKNVALIKFYKESKILNNFTCLILSSKFFEDFLEGTKRGGTQNFISLKDIRTFKIPLPPLETQQQVVAQIEEEQKAVEECKKLIAIFEQKIKDKISEVWGE